MANYDEYNPIRKVAPYDEETNTVGTYVYVPIPSKYQYDLQDVSRHDAGRTEDALMHKQRITQKVKLEIAWAFPSDSAVAEILNAFNAEYLSVEYKDAKANNFVTKIFYVGDRTSPLYNTKQHRWESVAFNIIER